MECPICLESAAPPVSQCVHGHILCVICRPKTTRCPICRVRLGQGRCLLADKLHRVLRDTFHTGNETATRIDASDRSCNLRDQLFGKISNRHKTLGATRNNCSALKPRQFLLARLLLGDREKAASADNLTRVPETPEETAVISVDRVTTIDSLHVRLSLNDRAKSASTGELSRDSESRMDEESSTRIAESNHELSVTNIDQSLSLPQTPIWGGSTDSVSYVPLACPLLQSCREVTTSDSLLEHIRNHTQVPQVHFYSGSARIPLPLPFGCDALYIFHHGGDVFFFQVCTLDANRLLFVGNCIILMLFEYFVIKHQNRSDKMTSVRRNLHKINNDVTRCYCIKNVF